MMRVGRSILKITIIIIAMSISIFLFIDGEKHLSIQYGWLGIFEWIIGLIIVFRVVLYIIGFEEGGIHHVE